MENNAHTSRNRKALQWLALTLVSVVVLDWLLDGRLRQRLPGKRRGRPDNVNL